MRKRAFLWLALFLGGALLGFEVAWLMGLLRLNQQHHAAPRESIELVISATIDGSDRFIFTPDHVVHEHLQWGLPQNVVVNDLPWPDLTTAPEGWVEFARQLDLPRATISTRSARDVIALEPSTEGFDLFFADTQMGAGRYTVTISIPRKRSGERRH